MRRYRPSQSSRSYVAPSFDKHVGRSTRNGRMMRRLSRLLAAIFTVCLAATAFGTLRAGAATGQDTDAEKTLYVNVTERTDAGTQKLEGIGVTVSKDGAEIASGKTNDKGQFSAPLPEAGKYQVEIDTKTLPDGKKLRSGTENPVTLDTATFNGASVVRTFPVGAGQASEVGFTWGRLLNSAVSGLRYGLVIALTAIGLSLIFGTTGLTNFAHGEMVTFGAGAALIMNNTLGWSVWIAFPLAILIGGIAGLGNEYLVWQPLRDGTLRTGPKAIYTLLVGSLAMYFAIKMGTSAGAIFDKIIMEILVVGGFAVALVAMWRLKRGLQTSLVGQLVVSIGLSILFRYLLYFMVGGRNTYYAGMGRQLEWKFGPVGILPIDVGIMAVAILVLVGVGLMLQMTRLGKAIRAVADNRPLASASGINVQQVILRVWAVGGALAALGGIMQTIDYGVRFDSGSSLLLLMFAGVTLGGLGTAYGALLGSVIVGILVGIAPMFIASDIKELPALLILVLILLVRPKGILGRSERVG